MAARRSTEKRGPILVGYDGSDASERALARALDEAGASRRELVVLAVYELPLDPAEPQYFGTLDDSRPLLLPEQPPPPTEEVLARARATLEAKGSQAELAWAAGQPAEEIVRAARDRSASLIVVGSHHHSLLRRLLGEDVAAAVRHDAHVDVLVVD